MPWILSAPGPRIQRPSSRRYRHATPNAHHQRCSLHAAECPKSLVSLAGPLLPPRFLCIYPCPLNVDSLWTCAKMSVGKSRPSPWLEVRDTQAWMLVQLRASVYHPARQTLIQPTDDKQAPTINCRPQLNGVDSHPMVPVEPITTMLADSHAPGLHNGPPRCY